MPARRSHDPWLPVEYTDRDAGSIKALAHGDADEETQRHALRFIVETLCACYDQSFRPEGDRETCFAEGRRYVGLQIVKMTKVPLKSRV